MLIAYPRHIWLRWPDLLYFAAAALEQDVAAAQQRQDSQACKLRESKAELQQLRASHEALQSEIVAKSSAVIQLQTQLADNKLQQEQLQTEVSKLEEEAKMQRGSAADEQRALQDQLERQGKYLQGMIKLVGKLRLCCLPGLLVFRCVSVAIGGMLVDTSSRICVHKQCLMLKVA